ncbi:uncharacterized protein LOC129598660 [Paramacrobiotus metropolitanus]|uniref:uncharacterized protein LOC129598660 n=1 Tax=Paramacrobiotus metropolitanus TaxID=2943436 RepID=UPI002445A32E|nr:uncharacterized protein LOC129598660 [Paramacrobiotus metropolitanus]
MANRGIGSLASTLRDVLVKAQIGEETSNLRYLKLSKTHITLNGLICAARDVFFETEKEFPVSVKSVIVQVRDKDGDFVMLRDDSEIQLLDVPALLNQTMFKFILLDENGKRCASTWEQPSGNGPNRSSAVPSKEYQTTTKQLSSLETMITQLSANFAVFRNQVLQDITEIKERLESEKLPAPETSNTLDSLRDLYSEIKVGSELQFPVARIPTSSQTIDDVSETSSQVGNVCVKFFDCFYNKEDDIKVTLVGKTAGEQVAVHEHIFHKAVAAAEDAQKGSEALEFSQTILELTAVEACGCPFRMVLQDIQKSTKKQIVAAFYSPAGNRLLKVLHHWASSRWPDGPKRNRFTQLINGYMCRVFYGSSYRTG